MSILINSRKELYKYLNSVDWNSKKETKLGSVYFLIKYNNNIEPIYFFYYEGSYFESPCFIHKTEMSKHELLEYVKNTYIKESWEESLEFENSMHKNGYHYEIDCPQCAPFLPERLEILKIMSEQECLDWYLEDKGEKYD